jgi:catechol 2,3-dioxygenase-like lactoylglutathione lyase family enzyme
MTPLDSLRHDHVALRVGDYERTVAWYTDKLGFHVDKKWPFGGLQLAYLSRGSAKIEILGGGDAAPQPRFEDIGGSFGNERLHHFCLAVDDLDAIIEELSRREVSLVGEPFVVEEIGRRLAFVEDNSGNLIELSAPR